MYPRREQAAQVLRRREVDAHVEHVAEVSVVERKQALGDQEAAGGEIVGRAEGAVTVLVDGLHDRLVCAQVAQVLLEHVEVVAVGVERCDVALCPLPAVVAVVVVGAEVGDLVLAEDAHEPARDRRLPRPRVADDAEHHRARH